MIKIILLAFSIAPLFSVPAYTIWFGIMHPKDFGMAVSKMFGMSIYILPVAYTATTFFGLPAYFALRYFKLANFFSVTLLGVPLGLLTVSLIDDIGRRGTIGLGLACGISVSFAAALILNLRKN